MFLVLKSLSAPVAGPFLLPLTIFTIMVFQQDLSTPDGQGRAPTPVVGQARVIFSSDLHGLLAQTPDDSRAEAPAARAVDGAQRPSPVWRRRRCGDDAGAETLAARVVRCWLAR